MDINTSPNKHEIPSPGFPVITIVTTLLLLFLFAGLIVVIYYYSNKMDVATPTISGEQKLKELLAAQKDMISSYGNFDKATNTVRIPVDVSVQKMIEEGSKNGKLPFPMKPTVKPEPKAETPPAPKEVKKDEPKDAKKEEPKASSKDAPKPEKK
jgi:hypothetical protein